ncbi:hypothetical protein CCP3SC15_150011 [Gammaproteobacteria bacterium]
MAGWGDVFGKMAQWFPGRKESMLNRIAAVKEEMRVIQTKPGKLSARDGNRLIVLSNELSVLQQKVGNAS